VHVSAYWQYVWTGILTLIAVGIYSVRAGSWFEGAFSFLGRLAGPRLRRETR